MLESRPASRMSQMTRRFAAITIGLAMAVGAMIGFLLIIGLGVAIDVALRGQGLIVLWVFAGAFLVLSPYMDR